MEVKIIEKMAFEIGVAQGMAGATAVLCGILFTLVFQQHREIRKIKEKMGSKEEA